MSATLTESVQRCPLPGALVRLVSGDVFPECLRAAREFIEANRLDFGQRPIYLVPFSDLIACNDLHNITVDDYQTAHAFTGGNLSEKLERYLQFRKAWCGNGFAVAFNVATIPSMRFGLETLIHEAGHESNCMAVRIASYLLQSKPMPEPKGKIPHGPQANAAGVTATHVDVDSRAFAEDAHGPQFVRAVLHLWHRVNQRIPISLDELSIAGSLYGMSNVANYALVLREELEQKRDLPVWRILLTRAPKLFNDLWEYDHQSRRD